MSMFSAIDAEHHLKVIKEAIAKAKKEVSKEYPRLPRRTPKEKILVDKALKIVWDHCSTNIFE